MPLAELHCVCRGGSEDIRKSPVCSSVRVPLRAQPRHPTHPLTRILSASDAPFPFYGSERHGIDCGSASRSAFILMICHYDQPRACYSSLRSSPLCARCSGSSNRLQQSVWSEAHLSASEEPSDVPCQEQLSRLLEQV